MQDQPFEHSETNVTTPPESACPCGYASDNSSTCDRTACAATDCGAAACVATVGDMLRRLRAPALRVCFRMKSGFIPDIDQVRASGEDASACHCIHEDNQKQDEGCITVRLFDLALCLTGIMAVCRLMKGCGHCSCARKGDRRMG